MSGQAEEMNAEQYRRLVENRRRRGARPLGEPAQRVGARTPLGKVLATAARTLRLRQQAEQTWCRLVPPELSNQAWIDGVVGDALVIAVASAAAGFELRRRQSRLEQRLSGLVPGLRRLRVVSASGEGGAGLTHSDSRDGS